jgi:hypothetical protein
MNKSEVLKGLSMIEIAYGSIPSDKIADMVELWYMFLDVHTAENYYRAIKNHIKESRYKPTIHEIVKKVREYDNSKFLLQESEVNWTDQEKEEFEVMVQRLRELSKKP